jgi:hypothetical protein
MTVYSNDYWWDDLEQLTDLRLKEGTIYGERYHGVQPVGGIWQDIEQWCVESFGDGSTQVWQHDVTRAPAPQLRWYMNNRIFWFRDVADRDWFLLRWR